MIFKLGNKFPHFFLCIFFEKRDEILKKVKAVGGKLDRDYICPCEND